MLGFYIISMVAVKKTVKIEGNEVFHLTDTQVVTDYYFASSRYEAVDIGTKIIKEKYPATSGWGDYNVFAFEVPPEHIAGAYKKVVLKEE
jgi:hypothetical protein